MNTPCAKKVHSCLPCNDWPLLNLSAEGPDDPVKLAIVNWDPPPNIGFKSQGCLNWCFSAISQADADACAAAQAIACADNSDGDLPGVPPGQPVLPGGGYVYNDEQRFGCGPLGDPSENIIVTGALPPHYSVQGTELVLAAGVFPVSTTNAPDAKKAANDYAKEQLYSTFYQLLAQGIIICNPCGLAGGVEVTGLVFNSGSGYWEGGGEAAVTVKVCRPGFTTVNFKLGFAGTFPTNKICYSNGLHVIHCGGDLPNAVLRSEPGGDFLQTDPSPAVVNQGSGGFPGQGCLDPCTGFPWSGALVDARLFYSDGVTTWLHNPDGSIVVCNQLTIVGTGGTIFQLWIT